MILMGMTFREQRERREDWLDNTVRFAYAR